MEKQIGATSFAPYEPGGKARPEHHVPAVVYGVPIFMFSIGTLSGVFPMEDFFACRTDPALRKQVVRMKLEKIFD